MFPSYIYAGHSERDAYKLAEDWLIANGKEIVKRLDWPEEFKKHFVRYCPAVLHFTLRVPL